MSDKRGKLHNVHITDVRHINMTEKVTTQLEQVYRTGRTAKNLIPQGLIPDLGWNTDQQGPKRQTLPKEKQLEAAVTQSMPTQVEGPPSSRLCSKTSKNTLPHEQNQQDPLEHNRTVMDLPNITHEVHQLHIIETTQKQDAGCLADNAYWHIVTHKCIFLFQIINDAKSAPFAYIIKSKKNPCIPPK